MSISFLRQLLMKEAVKKSAGSSGIMTINKNIVKDVDQLLQKYINDALAQGVDLDTLSPEQLKMIVAMNQPKPPKVFSGQEAMDQLNKLFPKTGEVFDLQGNKLNPNKPIMGGTQGIETLLKKGDVTKGTVSKKSDKVVEREMFEEANKKFNKASKEDETQFFKDVDEAGGMEAFLDKNPIGGPTKKIKPKMSNEEFVADSVARITSMEPVAAMKEANKIIKREGIYKNLDETQSKKILQDTEDWIFQRDPADRYDYKKNRPFRDDPNFDPDDPSYDPDDGLEYATGGRAGFSNGLHAEKPKINLEKLRRRSLIHNDQPLYIDRSKLRDLLEALDGGSGIFPGYDVKNDLPKEMEAAKGGRAGYYTGGMIDVEPNLSDIGHGSDSLMARTRLVSPDGQATTSTGLNYLLAEDNDNIRVPFAAGGDPKRRAFLKLLAALTGGAAAFKTGILGLGQGAGKKAVSETVKKAAGSSEVPPYFFKLVDKIKTMGDETLASQDKAIAKKYKDYVMEEDFSGNITIIKKNMDDPYPEEVIMSYKVDDVSLPSGKGMAKVDEYEEFTVRPDKDGKMKNIEGGVPDEVVNEGSNLEFTKFNQKADGGRIGFSAGGGLANVLARLGIKGSSRRFLEKAFGKENFENMIKNDPEMHRGLLEVVEMFRNRDKEGLKMYMQKFLPHMDDVEIEQFIVGTTPDIEGLSGQLTRLGSGRDYAQKLEMMKKADEVKKLENFDIKNVTKNAEGGRIGFSGGGIFRAIIAKAAAAKGMKPYEFIKVTSYKSLPPEVKMFLSADDFAKLKSGQQDMYTNYIDMAKTRKDFQQQVESGKKTPASMVFEHMEKSMDKQSYVPKTVTADDIAEMELMVKNRFNKGRKDNADGGIQTMLGE